MSDQYHVIQRKILSSLLFADQMKYSQLKPVDMEGSQFMFHLGKLIHAGLVMKNGDMYMLTAKGKNVANTFDQDSAAPSQQAKHSVVFCATRITEGKEQFLLYTRKKNPFFDHQGFPTGKVMYGETILETAQRELLEETGLIGEPRLIGIRHFRVFFPSEHDLVEDKVMYLCKIENPYGELQENKEGEIYWVDEDKVAATITKPLPEFQELFDMITHFDGQITFAEKNHYPKQF